MPDEYGERLMDMTSVFEWIAIVYAAARKEVTLAHVALS
jgi:hypothetical protein